MKGGGEGGVGRVGAVKTEVDQAYLTGRFFLNKRNEADLRRGIAYFEQAIREDIQYAPAYAGLAEVYFFLAHPASALEPKEASRLATAAAKKALSLDPTLGEAHAILAFVKDHLDWDWRSAQQEYKLALELNPNHAMVHKWYSGYLARMGRRDESLVDAKRAQRLDPLAANAQLAVADWFAAAGQYDKAIKEYQRALLLDPNNGAVRGQFSRTYHDAGMYQEALAEARKAFEVSQTPWN